MFWASGAGKTLAAVLIVVASVLCGLAYGVGALFASLGFTAAGIAVGGCIAGYQSYVNGKGFWRGFERYINGNWAQSVAISAIVMIISVGIRAIAAAVAKAGSKKPVVNSVTEQDGVIIQKAQQGDFTEEAWSEVQALRHDADGNTISSAASGRKIHKGFRTDANGRTTGIPIKGAGRTTGKFGFTDGFDYGTNTIYELKPNNPKSITMGIAQLHRYSLAYQKINGIIPKLVLVLY